MASSDDGCYSSPVGPVATGTEAGKMEASPAWTGFFERVKKRPGSFYAKCEDVLASQDLYEPSDLADLSAETLSHALQTHGATAGVVSFLEQAAMLAKSDAGIQDLSSSNQVPAPEFQSDVAACQAAHSSPEQQVLAAEEAKQRYLAHAAVVGNRSCSATLEFPAMIGPFTMSSANLASAFNAFYRQHSYIPKPDPDSDENSMVGLDPAAGRLGAGDIIFCQISPLHPITLDTETKAAANIPQQATCFAWAYPAVLEASQRRSLGQGAEAVFLEYGGYLYFNDHRDVVGTNSICPAILGTLGLMFGRPQILPQSVAETLTRQGRFQEITLEPLAQKGATHFAWIRPTEFSDTVASPNGCFAYRFATGAPKYFPVVDTPVYTPELLQETLEDNEAWVVVRIPGQPDIEQVTIFDKTQMLAENLQNQSGSNVAGNADLTVTIGKDTQPNLSFSYEEWSQLPDQGSIEEPWILTLIPCH